MSILAQSPVIHSCSQETEQHLRKLLNLGDDFNMKNGRLLLSKLKERIKIPEATPNSGITETTEESGRFSCHINNSKTPISFTRL